MIYSNFPMIYIGDGVVPQVVFTREGEQPDGWQRANITIGALTNFNVTIWGIVGDGYMGDIAIDDVALVGCAPPAWDYVSITEPPVST